MNSSEEFRKVEERMKKMECDFELKKKTIEEQGKKFHELDELISNKYLNDENTVIKVNVGGKEFTTLVQTLVKIRDTLFYNILWSYIQKSQKTPEELFFDRPFTHFDLILNYLKYNQFSYKNYSKYERADILDEIKYYGLDDALSLGQKKNDIDIEWDATLSKANTFTINGSDGKLIEIRPTTCYSHWVCNKAFSNEDFEILMEVDVQQTDTYLYVGIANENYKWPSNCGCCNPKNAWYVQCNGNVHDNGKNLATAGYSWQSEKIQIGMKVMISESNESKCITFSFPEKNMEIGPYNISGNNFRPYVGHCNKGSGRIEILECTAI